MIFIYPLEAASPVIRTFLGFPSASTNVVVRRFICTEANSDGDYHVFGLIGGEYTLRAERPVGYTAMFYPGVFLLEDSQAVAVSPLSNTTGIDFNLPPGSVLSGHIDLEGGPVIVNSPIIPYIPPGVVYPSDLSGIQVCIESSSDLVIPRCTKTTSEGNYQFEYVTAGEYILKADPVLGHLGQYYPAALTREDSVLIVMVPPADQINLNMTLPYIEAGEDGTISGYILNDAVQAQPISGINVCAYASQSQMLVGCSRSAEDGFYWIGYLGAYNAYQINPTWLRAIPDSTLPYAPTYYGDQFYFSNAQTITWNSTWPLVSPGLSNINIHLPPAGSIRDL